MAEVYLGYSPKPTERLSRGKYLVLGGRNLQEGQLIETDKDSYLDDIDKPSFRRAIAKPGDIIINMLFGKRKIYKYNEDERSVVINSSCAVIRSPDNSYILSYLQSKEGRSLFMKQARRATSAEVIPRLSLSDLKKIKIPIIPIDNLEKITDDHIKKASPAELHELNGQIEFLKKKLSEKERENIELNKFAESRQSVIKESQLANSLLDRIRVGESKTQEFKSTLRYCLKTQKPEKYIGLGIAKTLAAFLNSGGGYLFVGVDDSGDIVGLDRDFSTFKEKNLRDAFSKHFDNLINKYFDDSYSHYLELRYVEIMEKTICVIEVKRKASHEVWLEVEGSEKFFVRRVASTSELRPREAVAYIRENWA